jgi:hypothetical protein
MQRDFAADKIMLRTIIKNANQNAGVYGNVTRSADLRIDDIVYVK